jgi:hypothetical protein
MNEISVYECLFKHYNTMVRVLEVLGTHEQYMVSFDLAHVTPWRYVYVQVMKFMLMTVCRLPPLFVVSARQLVYF